MKSPLQIKFWVNWNHAANFRDDSTGVDFLHSLAVNDTFVIDHIGDRTFEIAGGGIDLVQSSITYTLGANVEHLTLLGAAAINAAMPWLTASGTTDVRNTSSKHWKCWLGVESRCLVPWTRFAEPDPASKVEGRRTPNAWFTLSDESPLTWTPAVALASCFLIKIRQKAKMFA